MIVDCHSHIGRNEHIGITTDDLLRSMDEAGIDKSLVFAGRLNNCPNKWMLEQIAPYKDRLIGVATVQVIQKPSTAWVDVSRKLVSEEMKEVSDWFGEGKIVACKFYTGYEYYFPAESKFYLEFLQKIKCPAIFHSGDCLSSAHYAKLKYAHPLHIDDVAVDYPNMKFVIAHMGYPWHHDAAQVCFKNANVFADISGFVYGDFKPKDIEHFHKVVKEFVDIAGNADKLIFGSDFPISNQKSYLDVMLGLGLNIGA